MTDKPKLKLVFAEGCFDDFDGTQEELNELIAEIHRQIESGEFLENSEPVDMDSLEDDDPELFKKLTTKRTLN